MFYLRLSVLVLPTVLMGLWAQIQIWVVLGRARNEETSASGFKAGRAVLDAADLSNIAIEQSPGLLSDHYDARRRAVRLSEQIYHGRNIAAVAIAAHHAGGAIQHCRGFRPLALGGIASAAASFGSLLGIALMLLGVLLDVQPMFVGAIILFDVSVLLQLLGLPIQWDANRRVRPHLLELQLVDESQVRTLNSTLTAAALLGLANTVNPVLVPVRIILWCLHR